MDDRLIQLKNGKSLSIREAEIADAESLIAYAEKVSGETEYLTFGPGEFVLSPDEEKEFIRISRATNNRLFIVGLIDHDIVSMLNFTAGKRPRTQHSGEFSMSVIRSCWGQRIGGAMVDTLLAWAGSNGIIRKINLCVRTDNQRAIRLYEAKKFIIEGTQKNELYVNGRYYDVYRMGRAI